MGESFVDALLVMLFSFTALETKQRIYTHICDEISYFHESLETFKN